MISTLHISDDLSLPPETVTSTLIVYGGKGMGKTNLGAVLVEELYRAKLRWCVLDPMGVWWGLRHAKDGKGRGIECLILGGAHGDIPIEPTGGAVAADLVVDEDANVIIDFSRKPNGETWGVGEKIRFITDYGQRLFQRQGGLVNGKRREPIFQVLDEAARFIPQMIRAGQPELAQCLSVWAQMVEEGRNFGLGVCLLTQRSARLNKDVAELADAMIAFRTVGPNSIGAVMDWMGEHVPKDRIKELVEKVRSLPVGRCLVVSPGWLNLEAIVQIRPRQTFDSSATPKPGESAKRVTGEAAKPDLDKYAARMKETIERVKQNDPSELKRTITALQKQLAAKPSAAGKTVTKEVKIVDPRSIAQAVNKRDGEWKKSLTDFKRLIAGVAFVPPLPFVIDGIVIHNGNLPPPSTQYQPRVAAPVQSMQKLKAESNGDVHLKPGALRMLVACATWYPKVIREGQVAAQAGVKRGSGTFSSYKSNLVTAGLVSVNNGEWSITDAGMEQIGSGAPSSPQNTEEVLAIWKPKLKPGAIRMLDVLLSHAGRAIEVEQLSEESGIASGSGTFSSYLSNLATAGLITKPQKGMVAANRETLLLE